MPTLTKTRHIEALTAELRKRSYAKLSAASRAAALNAPQPTGATAMVMRSITVEEAAKQAKDYPQFAALQECKHAGGSRHARAGGGLRPR